MSNIKFKVVSREYAKERGLKFFFTGKACKRGHVCPRYTSTVSSTGGLIKGGDCYLCGELMKEKGSRMLDRSFEDIMASWDPTTHNLSIKKLPYLSGTKAIGYTVKGFTYIDAEWYSVASKLLWIKVLKYITCTLSKNNLTRIGKTSCIKRGKCKCIRLHSFVLGISEEVPLIGDHKNGLTLDNRCSNLRLATIQENVCNSRPTKLGVTSKYLGVDYMKSKLKPYRGRVGRSNVVKTKNFFTETEAAEWRDTTLRTIDCSEFNLFNYPLIGERGINGKVRCE